MDIDEQFTGLDMSALINEPLKTTDGALMEFTQSTGAFIKSAEFAKDGNPKSTSYKFYKQIIKDDGTFDTKQMEVDLPQLSIVQTPTIIYLVVKSMASQSWFTRTCYLGYNESSDWNNVNHLGTYAPVNETVIHAFVIAFDFAGRAIRMRSHHSVGRIGNEEGVDLSITNSISRRDVYERSWN